MKTLTEIYQKSLVNSQIGGIIYPCSGFVKRESNQRDKPVLHKTYLGRIINI